MKLLIFFLNSNQVQFYHSTLTEQDQQDSRFSQIYNNNWMKCKLFQFMRYRFANCLERKVRLFNADFLAGMNRLKFRLYHTHGVWREITKSDRCLGAVLSADSK